MSNVATLPNRPKSVTLDMADRFGMEAQSFERTLRATVFPANAPAEEFAAFLLVAKQYNLNPILKEIYAYPKRGGGIVPIVSIDGWCNLINSNPNFDGLDFEEAHDDKGNLVSIKCSIYRKDRSHPVTVTEYLSECVRPTEPWKMKHRMLRHKSLIQCGRYAFGLAGIYDEDEAERIIENAEREPRRSSPPTPPKPPAPPVIEHKPAVEAPVLERQPEIVDKTPPAPPKPPAPPARKADAEAQRPANDFASIFSRFEKAAAEAKDIDALNTAWEQICGPHEDSLLPPDHEELVGVFRRRERDFEP